MTAPGTTYAFWHAQARSLLGQQIARFIAENWDRYSEADTNGAHFHYVLRQALSAPDSETALGVLIQGLNDMQESITKLSELATTYAKSRLSAGVLLVDDPDTWMREFAARKEQQLADEMRSPDA